jgi:hypothetical protein
MTTINQYQSYIDCPFSVLFSLCQGNMVYSVVTSCGLSCAVSLFLACVRLSMPVMGHCQGFISPRTELFGHIVSNQKPSSLGTVRSHYSKGRKYIINDIVETTVTRNRATWTCHAHRLLIHLATQQRSHSSKTHRTHLSSPFLHRSPSCRPPSPRHRSTADSPDGC